MADSPNSQSASRRDFIKTTGAAAVGVGLTSAMAGAVHAAGSETLKVGLVGCGGRGSGAVKDALTADPAAELVAVGDTFADRMGPRIRYLKRNRKYGDRIKVDDDHIFAGFDAYKQVIDSDVDVVLLATPPHFRPAHLAYAIEKGKHVFCEKPVAVDGQGVRSVMETCRQAKEKGLSVVSGLCYRYHEPKRELMKRVHDGAVGEIIALHTSYNTGELWYNRPQPGWSPMETQVRNWLYYTWLSGDLINEQHIHSLDKMAWAMQDEYPVKVSSIGGRIKRTGEEFGHVYDHFCSVYTYADGTKCFSTCRQQSGCTVDINDYIMGTKGTADVMGHRIRGFEVWPKDRKTDMYLKEHEELFAAIRAGEPINDGDYMSKSTLMAIMARESAYSGKDVTWDEAFDIKVPGPSEYVWGSAPEASVRIPGIA
ncbi:MAG: gfo/Idh/MocA family oxidoreductase [Planctomycetota bacterium]|nr:MAG: gfo/Idh/MocA family oxidoreductase [Planctomycetota bacterium]REK46978.1 MAG: gfo/Idh/MocA family oxidoreductase [Planctomycetota bacterium]